MQQISTNSSLTRGGESRTIEPDVTKSPAVQVFCVKGKIIGSNPSQTVSADKEMGCDRTPFSWRVRSISTSMNLGIQSPPQKHTTIRILKHNVFATTKGNRFWRSSMTKSRAIVRLTEFSISSFRPASLDRLLSGASSTAAMNELQRNHSMLSHPLTKLFDDRVFTQVNTLIDKTHQNIGF